VLGIGALVTLGLAGPAHGQSAWARGDRAFRDGRYADAESLYALRLGKSGPAEVAVNRATAQALGGKRDRAIEDLTRHAGDPGEVGRTARYNLGTVQGEMGQLDEALRTLREALERNPSDEDARWNYEILLRRKQHPNERPNPSSPKPQPPQPQPPQPQPSQQSRGNPPPPPQGSGSPQQPQSGGSPQNMSRQQAEQLLSALQEMSRAERQRQQKVRVLRERRGKDW
jgi:tetratricopeptide (TPR) repeat protein